MSTKQEKVKESMVKSTSNGRGSQEIDGKVSPEGEIAPIEEPKTPQISPGEGEEDESTPTKISTQIPDEMYGLIKALSKRMGISISEMLRQALYEWMFDKTKSLNKMVKTLAKIAGVDFRRLSREVGRR